MRALAGVSFGLVEEVECLCFEEVLEDEEGDVEKDEEYVASAIEQSVDGEEVVGVECEDESGYGDPEVAHETEGECGALDLEHEWYDDEYDADHGVYPEFVEYFAFLHGGGVLLEQR